MTTTHAFTHYGADFSMYSGKTRSYLRYKGIPFEEQLANRQGLPQDSDSQHRRCHDSRTGNARRGVHPGHHGHHRQPRKTLPGAQRLSGHAQAAAGGFADGAVRRRMVADPGHALPLEFSEDQQEVHLRRVRQGGFANAAGPIRRMAGKRLARRFSGMLPLLGITDRTSDAIENWYCTVLDQLNTHFSQYPYLLGTAPVWATLP